MYRRTFAILISVLALAGIAAGCGGGDDNGESLTKAEFIHKASTLCKDLYKEVQKDLAAAAEAQQSAVPDKKAEELLVNTIIIPTLQKQSDALKKLGSPDGDEDEIDAITAELDRIIESSEENPVGVDAEADPFLKVDQMMKDYGLEACRH